MKAESTTRPYRIRGSRILRRHIQGEVATNSLVALALFCLLIAAGDVLAVTDWIVNRGLGLGTATAVLGYRLVPSIARALPIAVLLGTLLALSRLAADREWLALETCGVGPRRIAWQIVGVASVAALAGVWLGTWAAPRSLVRLDTHLMALASQRPQGLLQPGVAQRFGDTWVWAREVSSDGRELRGVLLHESRDGMSAFAQRGQLRGGVDEGWRLRIEDGVVLPSVGDSPRLLRFGSLSRVVPQPKSGAPLSDWLDTATMSELMVAARTGPDTALDAQPDDARSAAEISRSMARRAWAEWHRRAAVPMAALPLALLAFGWARRGSLRTRASGLVLGIGSGVLYYALVQLAEGLVRGNEVDPALAVWLPDAVLLTLALLLVTPSETGRGTALWSRISGGLHRARRAVRPLRLRTHRHALDRDVTRRFASLAAAAAAALLIAYLAVDVFDNLKWFAKYQATPLEIARFYLARLPVLCSRVVPTALLLGAALTASQLAARGELIGMRACGISTRRAVLPILIVCALGAVIYLPIHADLAPQAGRQASRVKREEIKNAGRLAAGEWWARSDDQLFHVRDLDPLAGRSGPISIYTIGADGLPVSRTDADSARHVGGGRWRLRSPRRVELRGITPVRVAAARFADLGSAVPAELDTGHLTRAELREEIRDLEAEQYDATPFRVELRAREAAPVACLLLPALLLMFASQGPPFPSSSATLVTSALMAAAWLAITAGAAALGRGGSLVPLVAAWLPPCAFGLTGYVWLSLRRSSIPGAGRVARFGRAKLAALARGRGALR